MVRWLATSVVLLVPVAALAAGKEPWRAPDEAKAVANPLAADADAIQAGAATYKKRCKNCHGVEGRGDGPGSAYLRVPAGDLRSAAVQAQTDGELFWKLSKGRRPMPGFKSKLDEARRWQLVLFMRTLADPPAEDESEAEGDGDADTAGEAAGDN